MEHEALFTEREVLEAQSPQHLAKFVLGQADIIAQAERRIELANDVLTGYGTDIAVELERLNETETNTAGAEGDFGVR